MSPHREVPVAPAVVAEDVRRIGANDAEQQHDDQAGAVLAVDAAKVCVCGGHQAVSTPRRIRQQTLLGISKPSPSHAFCQKKKSFLYAPVDGYWEVVRVDEHPEGTGHRPAAGLQQPPV